MFALIASERISSYIYMNITKLVVPIFHIQWSWGTSGGIDRFGTIVFGLPRALAIPTDFQTTQTDSKDALLLGDYTIPTRNLYIDS